MIHPTRLHRPHPLVVLAALLTAGLLLACGRSPAHADPPRPVPTPEVAAVRVGLVFDASSCRLSCSGGLQIVQASGAPETSLGTTVTLRAVPEGVEINGALVSQTRSWHFSPAVEGAPIALNGREYRGDMVVLRSPASGRLHVVNVVDIDSYIAGVLAGEVPNTWPEETLKAQAVAARSYAVHKIARRSGHDWDVVATDRDQVYEGVRGEVPSLVRAVQATQGEVLTYGGEVIKAYFHSACGGHTESGAEAFGEDQPYLAGVVDPYCAQSPYQQWNREYTVSQLRPLLPKSWVDGGVSLLQIAPAKRNASGRVSEVVLVSTGGRQAIAGIDLRRLLGYRDVRSTWFDIQVRKSVQMSFVKNQGRPAEVAPEPQEVVVQMDQVDPVEARCKADQPFYVISASGNLERTRAGYAYAVTREGVLRTFAMRPGLLVTGLAHTTVVTRFKAAPSRAPRAPVRIVEKRAVPLVVRFSGRGWGHGVGLCQWGARGLAVQGADYRAILRFYYPGTQVVRLRD